MYECCPLQTTEIESTDALLAHIDAAGSLCHVVVQGLDLCPPPIAHAVLGVSTEDACFLGCRLNATLERHIHETGGTIFPAFTGVPFNAYRATLYSPEELMQGYERGDRSSLAQTTDGQIYAYYAERKHTDRPTRVMDALAFRIHDHAIDDALYDLLHGSAVSDRIVGVMGGHRLQRDEATYRQVARIAWELTRRDYFIATGGGPGAMEAANLGAYLAPHDAEAVDAAIDMMADQPQYDDAHYFDRALAVKERYPDGAASLAVPTWFYGHEPSNLFARHIAKYFANSIREDGLLAIARHGVIYAPGSAGTIQEVFMDAAQNHYATFGMISPMVFFGSDYWQQQKPVYPLLQQLADGERYSELLTITDAVDEVVDFIAAHAPVER